MEKWMISSKRADFEDIAKKFHIDPVVARIIRNRDITDYKEIEKYLNGSQNDMYSYMFMRDMIKALDILHDKIIEKKKIQIIGDYDVDGITATYILYKGLKSCGAVVDTTIPHRIKDGYGISKNIIDNAIENEAETILTCDNGIAASEAIAYAKSKGLTCIITDHHEIPYEEEPDGKKYIIPDADAVVDPKQENCKYPFKNICGAMIAFKLIEGMFERFDFEGKEECKRELFEIAAIGTVCDVMPLQDENRIIVKESLKSLNNPKNIGIKALLQACGLEDKPITAYHIGFIIGPCINATGRLESANISLDLLKSQDQTEATHLAEELIRLNEKRKEMTEEGIKRAIEIIELEKLDEDNVLVVCIPNLHESLAGIIAGRLRERYNKPIFVVTNADDGLKGSARSIPAYNIYEEMVKCKDLLTKFGGHKLAAGFSLEKEKLNEFRKRINGLCTLSKEDFDEKVLIDVPMPFSYVDESIIRGLEVLEPFGMENGKPVFAQRQLTFLSGSIMGKNANVAKFHVKDQEGRYYEAILFSQIDKFKECVDDKYGYGQADALLGLSVMPVAESIVLDVIYYPSVNEYKGRKTIQFTIQKFR